MAFFSRFAGLVVFLLAAVTLTACTTSSRVVRVYEGDALSQSNVAVLVKPGNVEIEQIDGKPMKSFLVDSVSMSYELLPGEHTVAFRYKSLWALPGRKEIGEKNAEEIKSELQQITFNAEAGRTYSIKAPAPASREEAQRMASTYDTVLVDQNSKTVAISSAFVAAASRAESQVQTASTTVPSVPASRVAEATTAAAQTPASSPVPVPANPAGAESAGGNLSKTEAMKLLWEGATAEEKKEFLRWAFQQK